jgi:threonyl-tRNA synthetase
MQMALPEKAAVEQADYKPLETIVSSIVKEKQAFQRLTLSKEDL